jgi:hypothetical protein
LEKTGRNLAAMADAAMPLLSNPAVSDDGDEILRTMMVELVFVTLGDGKRRRVRCG